MEVWIDEHVLVLVGDEEVLLNLSLLGMDGVLASSFLDQELWVLVFVEWAELVLVLA